MVGSTKDNINKAKFDRVLLITVLILLCFGAVIISSASVMESMVKYQDSVYQLKKHLFSIALSLMFAFVCAVVPLSVWKKYAFQLMLVVAVLMILTIIFGREINGAKRWLSLGFMNAQPSEFLKFIWILYFASHASRKVTFLDKRLMRTIAAPGIILGISISLLYLQRDFGSCAVLIVISMALLWCVGAKIRAFAVMGVIVSLICAAIIISDPYRVKRLTSFLDPWADKFDSGYQLTQSLMAYGRGGWFGEGLGNSYQKLGYIPEAHTDFITSVIGEEFGFVGMLVLLLLESILIAKAVSLGFKILKRDAYFEGYVCVGIGMWFAIQTFINIGSAAGMLPTKGLTLPFISYGGSSLMVCCAAVAVLLRIDYTVRNNRLGYDRGV
ncbi:MAG: putative lipid II flippase FtsW [Succinivibrio sp.]